MNSITQTLLYYTQITYYRCFTKTLHSMTMLYSACSPCPRLSWRHLTETADSVSLYCQFLQYLIWRIDNITYLLIHCVKSTWMPVISCMYRLNLEEKCWMKNFTKPVTATRLHSVKHHLVICTKLVLSWPLFRFFVSCCNYDTWRSPAEDSAVYEQSLWQDSPAVAMSVRPSVRLGPIC